MMPERVIKSLDGKRGAFLFVGGLAYLFIGLSYLVTPTAGRQAAFSWLPEMLTPQLLGWVWVIGGAGVADLVCTQVYRTFCVRCAHALPRPVGGDFRGVLHCRCPPYRVGFIHCLRAHVHVGVDRCWLGQPHTPGEGGAG